MQIMNIGRFGIYFNLLDWYLGYSEDLLYAKWFCIGPLHFEWRAKEQKEENDNSSI